MMQLNKQKLKNHSIRRFREGNPKMKFLRLFLSAVRRPPIRLPKKNFSWLCPCPPSTLRPGANPIKWGQSYTDVAKSGEVEGVEQRAEGGHWADHEGLWRTADGGQREVFTSF